MDDAILKALQQTYTLVVDDNTTSSHTVVLRSTIATDSEATAFIREYEELSSTKYIVYYEINNPQKIVYHKSWLCQHSSRNKSEKSKRNANCEASVDVKIKKVNKGTIKNDQFLKLQPPLPCIITINLKHNHNIHTADSVRMLRVSSETLEQFSSYFNDGLTPSEAKRLHESKVMINGDYEALAKASCNPTSSQLYHLHDKFRSQHFGLHSDQFRKLMEKLPIYEKEGALVKVNEKHPWSVLVITSVMERAQSCMASSEIVFVDSSSGCDNNKTSITILVIVTKAGGIPVAVLLHENQTTESYKSAFKLLKDNFPFCFGGKEAPGVFMTDDSAAEKLALQAIWPSSVQLLCHFHVAQAEWRWLLSSSSDVPKERRKDIMSLFQKVMYASSNQDLDSAIENLQESCAHFPKYLHKFTNFINRKSEWVLLYRLGLITRNNNTNNFCESAIRVLKDIVLCRTKAFNAVALVDFFVIVWNKYLITRLLDHAYNRVDKHALLYDKLLHKIPCYAVSEILQIDETTYCLPSQSNPSVSYVVDINIGTCTCYAGKSGAFCKHQCYLYHNLNLKMPNAPVLTSVDRHELGQLALGNDCPSADFFVKFDELCNYEKNISQPHVNTLVEPVLSMETISDNVSSASHIASDDDKKIFLHEMERLSSFEVNKQKLLCLTSKLKKIKNTQQLDEALLFINAALSKSTRKGGRIPVSSTSTARRRIGITKGCRRIPAGRPPKNGITKKGKKIRKLGLNISKGQCNAKNH